MSRSQMTFQPQSAWCDWRQRSSPPVGGRLATQHLNDGLVEHLNARTILAIGPSHIQIPRLQRVLLDKLPPRLDLVAHENAEDVIGGAGIVHSDLKQRAIGRVERRLAQLLGVHFAKPLEPGPLAGPSRPPRESPPTGRANSSSRSPIRRGGAGSGAPPQPVRSWGNQNCRSRSPSRGAPPTGCSSSGPRATRRCAACCGAAASPRRPRRSR